MNSLSPLSPKEMARYSRHIAIPEFNLEGQQRLKAGRVLVIGAGGLGSPLLLYLAAAGVGKIGIVDFDRVDETNLQRQVLYSVEDVGYSKAETAKKRLKALNPHIEVIAYDCPFTKDNALELIADYDVVADGTDNFPTRYLVNDACVLSDKINVYASIFRFEGQVSVFNYLQEDGERGPNYRDIFPEPPPPGLVPNCAEGGVLGVLPGIIGSFQANEVIKILSGVGEPLSGRFFLFDAASFTARTMKIKKNPATKIEGLINYEQFCGIPSTTEHNTPEISVQQLKDWMDGAIDFQLIDVREPYEYEIANLGGTLIPLQQIKEALPQIARDKPVVIHCRSGVRSEEAVQQLLKAHPFEQLYNLKGGILAWAEEIDKEMVKY